MVEQLPELKVMTVENEAAGMQDVVLQIPIDGLGSYQTDLGVITVKGIDLSPKTEHLKGGSYSPYRRSKINGEGVPGSCGRVMVDLSLSTLAGNTPERTIELHRKGIGSQQLEPNRRLWIDVGSRIGAPTGYERPVNRVVPVHRP